MATLRRSGKPYTLTPTQLMQSVFITSGALTALLGPLTKLEHVYRSIDEKDKRVKRASLTKKGIKTIDIQFNEEQDAIDFLDESGA